MSDKTKTKSNKLTFAECYSTSFGMLVGSGIISMTGLAIGYTGSGVFLAYILAGALCLISNFPLFIATSVVPKTSGNYFCAGAISDTMAGPLRLSLLLRQHLHQLLRGFLRLLSSFHCEYPPGHPDHRSGLAAGFFHRQSLRRQNGGEAPNPDEHLPAGGLGQLPLPGSPQSQPRQLLHGQYVPQWIPGADGGHHHAGLRHGRRSLAHQQRRTD